MLLAENERVGRLSSELHREKSQLEEMTHARDAVKTVRSLMADLGKKTFRLLLCV